jgi:hypothetical protein
MSDHQHSSSSTQVSANTQRTLVIRDYHAPPTGGAVDRKGRLLCMPHRATHLSAVGSSEAMHYIGTRSSNVRERSIQRSITKEGI